MFHLEKAIAAWRRSLTHNDAFLPEDVDELERHVRDQIAGLTAHGLSEEAAFHRALKEMGDYGTVETEYQKVYWGKRSRRRELLLESYWRMTMLRNYFKIAWRYLMRYRSHTLINIFGLALSMSVCLLILLLVREQMSYDRFHVGADRIVRVIVERSNGNNDLAATPAFLGPAIKDAVPGVEETVRLGQIRTNVIHEGVGLPVVGLYVEPSFFALFDFILEQGDARAALAQPNTLVLSDHAAERLFGDADPVGQVVPLEDAGAFTVTGVVRTRGLRSHLQFDLLASFASLEAIPDWKARVADERNFWSFANYILLEPGASTRPMETYLNRVSARYTQDQGYRLKLQPLTGIALGPMLSNEIASYSLPRFVVLFLGGLGLIVMLAAGFNYVGLTTVQALGRAREIGVRKTVGAARRQVVFQFLAESVLTALVALALAYVLLAALVPGFNGLTVVQELRAQVSPAMVFDPLLIGVFVAFSLGVGLLAGMYPALYLSHFRPVHVLKGLAAGIGRGGFRLRKVLTVCQLTLSLTFIVTTVLIYRQFAFMAEFDYGFRAEHVLDISLQGNDATVVRDEVLRHGGVLTVSAVSEPPASGSISATQLFHEGDTLQVTTYSVDAHFLDALGLRLLAGQGFDRTGSGYLLNATAARALGFDAPEEAVGKTVTLGGSENPPLPVLGVVQDYQFNDLMEGIEPLVLYHDPEQFGHLLVRYHPDHADAVVQHLQAAWERLDPVHPVAFEFLDITLHDNEGTQLFQDLIRIVGLVALIALTVACLGLLAMAAYTARLRTKEVGIRKAMGAEVPQIVWLLGREFAVLLALAVAFAVPLAWFANRLWLDAIANRVVFGPGTFVAGIGLVLVLALAAVGSQALRAALADPVDALRYE